MQAFDDALLVGLACGSLDILTDTLYVMADPRMTSCPAVDKRLTDSLANAVNLAVAFDDRNSITMLVMSLLSRPSYGPEHAAVLQRTIVAAFRLGFLGAFSALITTLASM